MKTFLTAGVFAMALTSPFVHADKLTCIYDGYALTAINHTRAETGGTRSLARVVISDTLESRGRRTLASIPASLLVKNTLPARAGKKQKKSRTVSLISGNMSEYRIDIAEALSARPVAADVEVFSVLTSEVKFAGLYIDEIMSVGIEVKGFDFNAPKEKVYKGQLVVEYDDGEDPEEKSYNVDCTYSSTQK